MDSFLQLNRDKLKAIFVRLSLVLLGLVSIVLAIAYLTGNIPNGQLLLSIILTTGVGFPLFMMFLGYVGWLLKRNNRQKAFSKFPFNDIEHIGFHKSYLDEDSKWALTEEIKEGKLNDFTLRMDFSKEKGFHFIEFDIPIEWKKLEKGEYRRLTKKFKQHNAELRLGSVVKQYDTRQQVSQTVSELKQDLQLFTTLLRQEGFKGQT
ncbi:MAG: hypothetical protein EOO46_25230 [Flavobacterium sp.]|nr:MAG: hypothetical protein EOO46_25230 [Flavobacterium sp.]